MSKKSQKQDELTATQTYTVDGRKFIVEPVFKSEDESSETLAEIFLKIILAENFQ